jgi:hypothetical protein
MARKNQDEEPFIRELTEDEAAELESSISLPEDTFLSAIVLRPREPFLAWARAHIDPRSPVDEQELRSSAVVITPELLRPELQEEWLRQNHDELFAHQLAAWTKDEATWPADRSLDVLRAWFKVEFVPAVNDMRYQYLGPEVTCGPVPLRLLIDEFDVMPNDATLFVDVQSGTIVSFTDADVDAIEGGDARALDVSDEDLAGMRQIYESPTLVALITHQEFDEFSAMVGFAESQPVASARNRLLDALHGRRSFRRFKDAVAATALRDRWFAWREAAVSLALQEVLDDLEIPYDEDLSRPLSDE